MDPTSRSRTVTRCRLARRAGTLALVACVVASCAQGPDQRASGSRSSATPGTAVEGNRSATPEVPVGDPAALARGLDAAAATVRDRHASQSQLRRAGEFQQLAVGALATAAPALRRDVTARLDPDTASLTGSQVAAARSLGAMTGPQKELPRWRIVAPRPPAELLGYYRLAQRRTGVPWTYLAAINLVETRMGRIRGASPAGARGPMQFLPATWDLYGAGGDINDPRDAILAAARLLRANGAPRDMAGALRHFNPSDRYVRAVTAYAQTIQRSPSAYRGYWFWRVLYRRTDGVYVLPVGYPEVRPERLPGSRP